MESFHPSCRYSEVSGWEYVGLWIELSTVRVAYIHKSGYKISYRIHIIFQQIPALIQLSAHLSKVDYTDLTEQL